MFQHSFPANRRSLYSRYDASWELITSSVYRRTLVSWAQSLTAPIRILARKLFYSNICFNCAELWSNLFRMCWSHSQDIAGERRYDGAPSWIWIPGQVECIVLQLIVLLPSQDTGEGDVVFIDQLPIANFGVKMVPINCAVITLCHKRKHNNSCSA